MSSTSASFEVSVVVPTLNEGERLQRTVLGLLESLPPGGEVIVVDDGSTDDSAAFLGTLGGPVRSLRTDQRGSGSYAVPLLPGAFLGIRRETFAAVGGFDPGLRLWSAEDAGLSLRLWLLGYEQRVIPQIEVAHFFRQPFPYKVEWGVILHNLLRVALVHFNAGRAARVFDALKGNAAFAPTLTSMLTDEGGIAARRAELCKARVRDDDWFFHSFKMDL